MLPSEEHAIEMFPMDFEEFLWAMGDEMLMPYIRMRFDKRLPMEAFHRRAMDYFRQYLIVGGMPQAVSKYVETRDFEKVDEVKRDILALYRNDIHKYADNQETAENTLFLQQQFKDIGGRPHGDRFPDSKTRTEFIEKVHSQVWLPVIHALRASRQGGENSLPTRIFCDGIRQRFCGQASELHGERDAHPAGNGIERRRQSHIRAKQPLHRRQQPFAYMGAEYAHSGTGDHVAEIMPPVVYSEERHAGGKGIGGCSPVRAVFHSHQLCSGECSGGMTGREGMVVGSVGPRGTYQMLHRPGNYDKADGGKGHLDGPLPELVVGLRAEKTESEHKGIGKILGIVVGFDLRSGAAPGCEAVGYGIVETLVREAVYGRSSTEEHCRSDKLHRSEHILMRHALLLSVTAGVHVHRPRTVSVLGVELRGGAKHDITRTEHRIRSLAFILAFFFVKSRKIN